MNEQELVNWFLVELDRQRTFYHNPELSGVEVDPTLDTKKLKEIGRNVGVMPLRKDNRLYLVKREI